LKGNPPFEFAEEGRQSASFTLKRKTHQHVDLLEALTDLVDAAET